MSPFWTSGATAVAATCAAGVALRLGLRSAGALVGAWRRVAEHDLLDLFIFVEPRRLVLLSAILLSLVGGTGWLLGAGAGLLLPVCAAGAFMQELVVRVLRKRRLQRLQAQLPDMLALWAGLLRSGRGVMPALSEVAAHQADPMGQELRLVLRHCRVGGSLDVAIGNFGRRVPDSDLALLATTLRLSQEIGGHLADALARLSGTVRERLLMESRIGALTAQGRLQGVILALLPLLLLVVLLAMEPGLAQLLWHEPVGWAAAGALCVLELLGYTAIRRVVSIRV